MNHDDIRLELGLRAVLNASGTMTRLGSSIVGSEAVAAISRILPEFVEMDALQRQASGHIARLCACEAGCVTASTAAAITLAVAASMTGPDLAAIERLPDTHGLKHEVLLMTGHAVSYGAPIEQAIRLAGAKVVLVGQATTARRHQLEGAITEATACAVYVVSHHTVQYGLLDLAAFAELCHAHGVPVIVDAASEYDLRGFLAQGADLALYSSHKFLGGPTGGIVAGRVDRVRDTYLQNLGIGRGMKVGKEGVVGTIAALLAWERRDAAAIREEEDAALRLWKQQLTGCPGITATRVPDPTGNPLDRLQVQVDPAAARISAWDLADALARRPVGVMVRDHEVEHGYFLLDPCNLRPGDAQRIADALGEELELAQQAARPLCSSWHERQARALQAMLSWPRA